MAETTASKAKQLSFNETLERISTHLDSGDTAAQLTACATLCTLLAHSSEPAGNLGAVAARLVRLLVPSSDASTDVLKNAAAALAAAMEASEGAVAPVLDGGLAAAAVARLSGSSSSSNSSTGHTAIDEGLALNLMLLLSALGGAGGNAGTDAVLAAGGLPVLLARCHPDREEGASVVAVDGVCRLASQGTAAKDAAVAAGAIPRLAAMLGSRHEEVRVRALLGLGMLIGESAARQRQLAEAPGAPAALLRLMRQADDLDSQHVAGELFRGLARNPELKDTLAAAMREAQAAAARDAEAKYV